LTVSVHKSKKFCTNAENRNSENDATDCHRPGGLQLLRRNRILLSRGRRKPYSLSVAIGKKMLFQVSRSSKRWERQAVHSCCVFQCAL
jgi:hypothetical protein